MGDILKIYTAEQLYDMYRLYLISKGVGITDFNEGAKANTLIESNSDIISSIAMDFKEGIIKAIPISLYEGFGFSRTDAVAATGYIRPYRLPAFYVQYGGAGTSALITSTATAISATVTGVPGDAFSFLYSTYTTISDVVTAINNLTNWTATLVGVGTTASTSIYQYTDEEVIDTTNYLYADGLDIMLSTDVAISVPEGFSVTVDDLQILTTADATIAAGDSGVQIAAEVSSTGTAGNILANALDTLNGSGVINSSIDGVEHAINDSAFSGGAAQETSTERAVRFSETVNALNAGTSNGIIAELKKITGVRSVGVRESYPYKGMNTILVDDGTGVISSTLLTSIEQRLYGDASDIANYPGKDTAGIEYTIEAPTIVPIDVTIVVQKLSTVTVSSSTIITAVQSAVEQYINTLKLGEDVILTAITQAARAANSAVYDVTISAPTSNTTISASEFAKTGAGTGGTVTVTVSEV